LSKFQSKACLASPDETVALGRDFIVSQRKQESPVAAGSIGPNAPYGAVVLISESDIHAGQTQTVIPANRPLNNAIHGLGLGIKHARRGAKRQDRYGNNAKEF